MTWPALCIRPHRQVGPGKGGPARVRVRSTDGEATLTLATAAVGEAAGIELKTGDKVATVRLEGDRVVISAPRQGL